MQTPNKLLYNNKEYSFLNHYVLEAERANHMIAFAAHDEQVISATPKKIDNNQFYDAWDSAFSDEEVMAIMQRFLERKEKIDRKYTALYNLQLIKEQQEKTIILDNVFQQCLIIDEIRYLLIEEEYGFHFVKEKGDKVENLDDENEFLHVLSYFFPILLREQAKAIVFDGFDLSIIPYNETTFLIYNQNQNFYVLREKESVIEKGAYVFRYVEMKDLSEKEQKEIQKLVKKEYDAR